MSVRREVVVFATERNDVWVLAFVDAEVVVAVVGTDAVADGAGDRACDGLRLDKGMEAWRRGGNGLGPIGPADSVDGGGPNPVKGVSGDELLDPLPISCVIV